MKVQKLQIEQQLAQIRIESQMASLSIQMPKRSMTVEEQPPQISVERQSPKIELDMEAFRNNIGLKSIQTINRESAARAIRHVEQSVKKFAGYADYIGTLPSSGNPIAEVAREKMLESKAPEMNSGTVPDGAVKMEGKPGEISINWSKHDLRINWDEFQTPIITVEPKASVSVQLIQEPLVEYTVVEQTIPPESGGTFDAEV